MAKATLELLKYKTKPYNPRRLILHCAREDNRKATAALGCEATKAGFTYPCDEVVVLVLKHLFGDDLCMTDDCNEWFEQQQAVAKHRCEMAVAENGNIQNLPYEDKLKKYQRPCIAWGVDVHKGIIADDRGLGKTLEAISIALESKATRVLIVAPGYLKRGWEREIRNWTNASYSVIVGERAEREQLLGLSKLRNTQFTIINYEMLRTEKSKGGYPELHEQEWDLVFFDEGHRLCNRNNQWTIGAKALKAKGMFILTGNPIANKPDDLWSILNLLNPTKFTSYWKFVEYYCNVVDGFFGQEIVGVNHNHLAQLQFTLQPLMMRRLKSDVAPYLPQKIDHRIEVDLEGKQKTFYKRIEKQMVIELENGDIDVIDTVVAKNLRMQQAISNPAILGGVDKSVVEDTALELIGDLLGSDQKKVIVGLWFRTALDLFVQKLDKLKIQHYIIHGEVKADARDTIVQEFKSNPNPCVLVGTIRAMSEGINVDECDNIIFMDKSYRPLDNDQFKDRIHRITSTRPKNYYHIVVRDSISEDREDILQQKQDMQDEVMSMEALHLRVARQVMERAQK